MNRILKYRPSPALFVAMVAVVLAIGGTAFATDAVPVISKSKHADAKQDTKLIKKLAKTLRVKFAQTAGTAANATNAANAANAAKAKAADTATNATHATAADNATHATGADSAKSADNAKSADSAKRADSAAALDGFAVLKRQRADAAADKASAPKVPLGGLGPFSFYGKCYVTGGNVQADIYVEVPDGVSAVMSTEDGSDVGDAPTNPYLTSATPEASRLVEASTSSATADDVVVENNDGDFRAATDSIAITGVVGLAMAKNGSPSWGDGPFGPGSGCLFGGTVFGA